ncbi:tripartite tricarboxylate transporter TctB family protein [Paracoccus beibuensis]|uniref:tripartite tricarboxylate transporter TctB family protein n=1 Tax=Paracoccus beibuensis TaxID=547602 RepID=UPI00223F796F|nr:tripartite tricarboxylate transporter TctB family protein [Paracoccus beibuensis]
MPTSSNSNPAGNQGDSKVVETPVVKSVELAYGTPPRVGAVVFALVAAAAMAGYAWTILGAARNAGDWLLIIPAAVIGVAALLWAVIVDGRNLVDQSRRGVKFLAGSTAKPVALLMLIGAYALALPFLGFDAGTLIFLAFALLIQGERRIWLITVNAVVGTALMIWVFHDLLMVRLPLSFL